MADTDSMLTDRQFSDHIEAAHSRYRLARPHSAAADTRARAVMPGGNTRSVLHFAPFPFRVEQAEGRHLVDVDGHRYVDFCGNYTAAFLGHSSTAVRDAVVEALDRGWALGSTHLKEIELAELICDRFPSIEQVRFTNSGTEANLMAIGTAMHASGRSGVGVFDHAYHGGVLGFGDLDGPPNPLNVPHRYIVAPFDDLDGLDVMFADDDLGCVLVEPVQGSGGCRPASMPFLEELRRRCTAHDVVLIFDEVMTSRLSVGGAQQRFGITPDMTTLGKYLGGGLTFGAFGGRADLMAAFDAEQGGALTQAGTFNNNVLSMSAAVAALRHELDGPRIDETNARGDRLRLRLNELFDASPVPMWVTGVGSMLCIRSDDDRLVELLFHAALDDGMYMARRGFMALSMAISDADCDALAATTERWLASL